METVRRFVAFLLFEKLYQQLYIKHSKDRFNSIYKHLEVGYKPAKFSLLPRVNSEGRNWPISQAIAQLFLEILVDETKRRPNWTSLSPIFIMNNGCR